MRAVLCLIIFIVKACAETNETCKDVDIQKKCIYQENCDSCLETHPCCHYCYDEKYSGRRCNFISSLTECSNDEIELNEKVRSELIDNGNDDFSDNVEKIIQLKPQAANIYLRKGKPVNLTFFYKPAKNYPLDLYYLGDLSVSMKQHLEVFKTIGKDLPQSLRELTENYKLAYGSFLDKTGMPFYFTDKQNYLNPCSNLQDNCETGYLFRHRLSFTTDTDTFVERIVNSKITANIDDLDGALDAILQILVCKKIIGWSANSRKIILLPTDSLLHTAGDGILVGATRKPNETCLLNEKGNHTNPFLFDYPDIGQIHKILRDKKVNIIFAVKDKLKIGYYRNLTSELLKDSAFVGELEADSKNILDLIRKGFYNFARQVTFYINTTSTNHVDVKFFADCEDLGSMNQTSTCYNVENKTVKFIAELTLKEEPSNTDKDILYIEEKNIGESIKLDIKYLKCRCKNYKGIKKECVHGDLRCGECYCYKDWTGSICNENCDEHDNSNCRSFLNGTLSKTCFDHGDCICGKCVCNIPYEGEYCQYECPVVDNKICGGVDRGVCIRGRCKCSSDFTGEDCSCSLSTTNCKLFDSSQICSSNGECKCNKCICMEGFKGSYCEMNNENNTLCDSYKEYIERAFDNNTLTFIKNGVNIVVEKNANKESFHQDNFCEVVVFEGNTRCIVRYNYYRGEDNTVRLLVTEKTCYYTAGFTALTMASSIFAAIVIGGLLFIIVYKYRIIRLERAEYKRFQDAKKNLSEMNPLYRDPVTTYRNPLLGQSK